MAARRKYLLLIFLIVLAAILLFSSSYWSPALSGLANGEPFYQGRPANYWARVLKSDVRSDVTDESIQDRLRRLFSRAASDPQDDLANGGRAACPVLVYLLRDEDSRVRE